MQTTITAPATDLEYTITLADDTATIRWVDADGHEQEVEAPAPHGVIRNTYGGGALHDEDLGAIAEAVAELYSRTPDGLGRAAADAVIEAAPNTPDLWPSSPSDVDIRASNDLRGDLGEMTSDEVAEFEGAYKERIAEMLVDVEISIGAVTAIGDSQYCPDADDACDAEVTIGTSTYSVTLRTDHTDRLSAWGDMEHWASSGLCTFMRRSSDPGKLADRVVAAVREAVG